MGRKSANREAILEAATHAFWTRGYEGLGVNEICDIAGINKGTLYHFYKDKEELILSVITKNSDFVANFVEAHSHLPPFDRVLAYFDMMRETQKNEFENSGHVAGCPFGNLSVEMGTRNEKIREAIDRWFDSMVVFLAKAIAESTASVKDAKSLADELFTHWQGAILRAKTSNVLLPLDMARHYTVRFLERLTAADAI